MVGFADRALLELADPARLQALIAPPGAVPAADLTMLLGSVYDLDHVRVDGITGVTVSGLEAQVPLYPVRSHRGSWTRNHPEYLTTDLAVDTRDGAEPVWVDLLARVVVHTVTEVDPGGIESAVSRGLDDFATLDEFRAQFRFIDLDAFLARHRLSTVEDLREAYEYLRTEVRFRAAGPFDPADPANAHDIEADLALLIRPDLELTAAMRAAVSVRTIAAQTRTGPKDPLLGRAVSPLAVAVVVDGSALGGVVTAAAVRSLFARGRVLSLVADPP
ncbi:hypothetical protein [Nucisporomicrobium flavum]|uniref:hypothetical protein n=1 Tax=Nucisporomicrobium flavum TaxID=2785915 RepID=UPI0018F6A17F|nr:hypothetical protein [Nucisporomicrobium flavum]